MRNLLFLIGLFGLLGCGTSKPPMVVLTGETMGTTYMVKYWQSEDEIDAQKLQTSIDDDLLEVNQQMSTYISDSELMQLNRWPENTPFEGSAALLYVLRESKRLGNLSDGMLDVTVGPLVNIWGFGPNGVPNRVPSPLQLAEAQAKVGLSHLNLDNTSVTKTNADMYIDLSTIAKGYGVDVVAERIESAGINNYLVEIGGELRLSGVKADDSHWRVAIEKPSALGRASQQEISVGDNAVATSGDYRQFFEQDGKRYSHLIDPITGMPISHFAASVTVVHPSAMTADGLATAFMIMGPERAKIMAQEYDIALFMLVKKHDGYSVYTSAEFQPFLIN